MNTPTLMLTTAMLGASALAAPEINWHSIDTGGGVTAGGPFTVRSVIGQHDAGPALSSGGFTVRGGFLTPMDPSACNPADIAPPFGILDLGDINAFVSGFITSDPIADFDGNGIFDLTDINTFISSFVAGCP